MMSMEDIIMSNQLPHLTSKQRGTYHDAWGTPEYIIEAVRSTYGCIDLDLASNDKAQEIVRARYYNTEDNPAQGLKRFALHRHGKHTIWCNPPGPSKNVRDFYFKWTELIRVGHQGAFFVFNLDHLRKLAVGWADRPLNLVVLRDRVKFVGAKNACCWPSGILYTGGVEVDYLAALGNSFEYIGVK